MENFICKNFYYLAEQKDANLRQKAQVIKSKSFIKDEKRKKSFSFDHFHSCLLISCILLQNNFLMAKSVQDTFGAFCYKNEKLRKKNQVKLNFFLCISF